MSLIDDGQPGGLPFVRLQAQEGNGDGSLTGTAESVSLSATTLKDLKPET